MKKLVTSVSLVWPYFSKFVNVRSKIKIISIFCIISIVKLEIKLNYENVLYTIQNIKFRENRIFTVALSSKIIYVVKKLENILQNIYFKLKLQVFIPKLHKFAMQGGLCPRLVHYVSLGPKPPLLATLLDKFWLRAW